jgi:Uma2 family endonuclease
MKAYLTPEQYAEIERKEEWKNEYFQGEMRPMPLPGWAHCSIVGNVCFAGGFRGKARCELG